MDKAAIDTLRKLAEEHSQTHLTFDELSAVVLEVAPSADPAVVINDLRKEVYLDYAEEKLYINERGLEYYRDNLAGK